MVYPMSSTSSKNRKDAVDEMRRKYYESIATKNPYEEWNKEYSDYQQYLRTGKIPCEGCDN